ncbi:dihydrolipoyl dehydrogenase [Desulfopila inferna]|uniref:dihydrolipoyl dehydrogenase n=1 Tax=Desulfopila inferna TaxID=468528 RepID=UPI001964B897|nr:dihydrolipoyl dehydrogenase [Desulfopila inferna]MBM9606755.1 dihydrolipoyl dehydrogenase [Desulfopila inferna]
MKTFDVVIIGGGPGGMAAGIMLSQAGKSVALIQEEQDSYGGICLNRGCMPTKSLLKAAAAYRHTKECEKYGLDVVAQPINLKRLQAVTENDLATLRGMTQMMVAGENITTFRGKGSFLSDHDVIISNTEGSTEQVRGELIIIATGSKPVELPFAPFNGKNILSSDQILQNIELPSRLLIIGGGAIGCEFATLYNTFGSEVILVEALDTLLPREDQEAGRMLQDAFAQQGIQVKTETMIEQLTIEEDKVTIHYKNSGKTDTVDKVLVGVGRKPNINSLNLGAAGVKTEHGAVKVNEIFQTSIPHIYCIGDAAGGLMLAHAAEKEGQLLAQNLTQGTTYPLNESAVPRVAFCHPEVAAVGVNLENGDIRSFTMHKVPNGRSVVDKVAPAFVKLFIKNDSSEIAGAVIIGEAATEMIHEIALAVENRLTLEKVGRTIHAHPTHSKSVVSAVLHAN